MITKKQWLLALLYLIIFLVIRHYYLQGAFQ